jgi:hypothetical protein
VSLHKARRRWTRGNVCWYVLGLAAVQLGLGVAVEWTAPLRDPVYRQKVELLAGRRAEAPTRPLFLALGSSRTLMGLDAAAVNETDDKWLTFNFGDLGAGPMLEAVFLRRLLAERVRPDLVLIEVVPLQLATSLVVPSEENALEPGRLSWTEMTSLTSYYRFPVTAFWRWVKARALASVKSQRELHDALRIDVPIADVALPSAVDRYGFLPCPPPSPEERAEAFRIGLGRYRSRLAVSGLADGPARALRELVALCGREHIPFAIVIMPECSGFRDLHTPRFCAALDRFLADLSDAGALELIDARAWVPDDGFLDVHHLDAGGARTFSKRLAEEVLPRLRRYIGTGGSNRAR